MAVKAICVVKDIISTQDDSTVYVNLAVALVSQAADGSWTISAIIENIDPDALAATIKSNIENGVKAILQASPYNVTFGVGDKVRCLTGLV